MLVVPAHRHVPQDASVLRIWRRNPQMPSLKVKRLLAAGGVAAVLGAAAIGVASAQQGPTPTPTRAAGTPPPAQATARAQIQQQQDKFLSSLASKLGVSVDKLKQAIADARQETGL